MAPELSRRELILLTGAGFAGGYYLTQSAVALENLNLSITDASVTTTDGTISQINLEDTSSIDFSWEGFDTPPSPTISTDVKASDANTDLGTAAKTYETILQNSLSLTTTSGSTTETFPALYSNETFPVDILGRHSGLSAADFAPASAGETKTTELVGRVTADTPEATATKENTFQITVEYVAGSNTIQGTVTETTIDDTDGTTTTIAKQGATVIVIDTTTDTLVETTTTDSNGNYSVSVGTNTYHVMVEDGDGNNIYSATSKPFVKI